MKKVLFALFAVMMAGTALAADDRPVVAVLEFKNETQAYWWQSGVGRELSDMLSNELMNTGVFKVVERRKLDGVLSEQDLGASGRVSKSSAAKMGQLTGAKYLVTGSVSNFEETGGKGGGVSFKGISVGGNKKTSTIGIDIRVIDSTTGVVEYARTVTATAKSGGMSLGLSRGGFGGALASEKKTPAGKAIRAVIIEITDYLACAMYDQDSCMDEYRDKERRRRNKAKGDVDLD
ncbi:MAG: CsgG/HfaB family protein [Gammaproteobacteria bacterium]|jgi:curli biogenesis system outer membrane secretion channel CsgG|nr:CsgG/HfaB family protein [Xanthomonadales bacterium]